MYTLEVQRLFLEWFSVKTVDDCCLAYDFGKGS